MHNVYKQFTNRMPLLQLINLDALNYSWISRHLHMWQLNGTRSLKDHLHFAAEGVDLAMLIKWMPRGILKTLSVLVLATNNHFQAKEEANIMPNSKHRQPTFPIKQELQQHPQPCVSSRLLVTNKT
jgi:hypothetical protein